MSIVDAFLWPVNTVAGGIAWAAGMALPAHPQPGGSYERKVTREALAWARKAAAWSELSYSLESEAAAKAAGWVFLDSALSTQAIVGFREDDAAIVVAFRGTAGVVDVAVDFDAMKIKGHLDDNTASGVDDAFKGAVHQGFAATFNGCREAVHEAVADLLRNNLGKVDRMIITGHSLGGALATLYSADVLQKQPWGVCPMMDDVKIITFGSPRVGDKTFAEYCETLFAGRYARWVNNMDVIPRALPEVMGYWHCGAPHLMYPDPHAPEALEFCWTAPNSREDTSYTFGMRTYIDDVQDAGVQDKYNNHRLVNYVASLGRLRAAEEKVVE